jgi:hypothetical protein
MRMSKQDQAASTAFLAKVESSVQIGRDMTMLRELRHVLAEVAARGGYEGKTAAGHLTAFSDILDRMENGQQQSLTDKQRSYLKSVHGQACKNSVAKGEFVAPKKEVPLPFVLRPENLPKAPPGRPRR